VKLALVLAAVPALAVLATACGDGPAPPRDVPQVRLELGTPNDGDVVNSDTVEIAGTVRPSGADVQVLGRDVSVDGGSFHTEVTLEPGANLIDVSAGARGRRPDFAVARVLLEVRLPVPDLAGSDADTAVDQLDGLGLKSKTEDAGGFLDPLLPGDPKVCETRPRAGEQVMPGTTVTLLVARDC
jgi:hypothetical protein